MYNEDVARVPADEDEFWAVLWQQFEFVRHVLCELDVETREEALDNNYHEREDGSVSRAGMGVIRYRDTGDELDQRDHYLAMGCDLLPYIHQSLDERKLTPEFVQQWGKVMFCHGYIASYVFDDSDDLSDPRKGMGGRKDNQKRWVAHILQSLFDAGYEGDEARVIAGSYIRDIISRNAYPRGFGEKWFRKMADSEGALASTYDAQHMYPKRIADLIGGGRDGIPPLPSVAELQRFGDPN